ncbi:MAG: tetratricopeptide repeat protein, partial [Rivularia sp. (in: cyanobacteria)]
MKRFKHLSLILLISLFLTILSPVLATPLSANSSQAQKLIEQGKKYYDTGRFTEAVNLLKQAASKYQADGDKLNQAMSLSNISLAYQKLGKWQQAEEAINISLHLLQHLPKNKVYAQSLDIKGSLQFAQAQFQNAIVNWQNAEKIYSQLNLQAALIQSRINQAQAMQALGLFLKAQKTLISVRESLGKQPDSAFKSVGLRSVGDVLRIIGNIDESKKVLRQSLDIAYKVKADREITETLISLGNTVRLLQEDSKTSAINYYTDAANTASNSSLRLQAQLNLFRLLVEIENLDTGKQLIPQINVQLQNLIPSRQSIYTRINFAKTLQQFQDKTTTKKAS